MPPKAGKKRASAADKAAEREQRSNAPTQAEFDAYFERLHEINDRMDEDMATHRGDMNAVYEEGAKTLDLTKDAFAAAFKRDRKRVKDEKKFSKADTRTRDSLLKVATAYGEDSPLGQWAMQMAKVAGAGSAADKKADKEGEADGE